MVLAGKQRPILPPMCAMPCVVAPPLALASARQWAQDVFAGARLGDPRRTARLVELGMTLAERPADSLPQACEQWAKTKAAYRFLENEAVTIEALQQASGQSTARQCVGQRLIIVPQDTTTLSFPTAHSLHDMGYSNALEIPALQLHSTLALREDGVPLGLLHLKIWSRDPEERGKKKTRRQRPIEQKESFKWIEGIRGARAAFGEAKPPAMLFVFDREGDVYEALAEILSTADRAVIRQEYDRRVAAQDEEECFARQRVHAQAPLGLRPIEVPRRPGRAARPAQLTLRAGSVVLNPARQRLPLALNLVEAVEENPPPGQEPLHWALWTTEPVATLDQAWRVVQLYMLRWKIEDYHRTLKSGCRVEDLRMHTAQRIARTVAIYASVAVRILQLRDLARQQPQAPCTEVLSDLEWKALFTRIHNQLPTPDTPIPSIRQAVLWIGRLGGHLGRKGDGMPGAQTLWRGWRDLQILVPVFALLPQSHRP